MTIGRQTLIVGFLCVVGVILQGLIAHAIAIRSAQPDIPLVVLACGGTLIGGASATSLGLLAGYLSASLTPTIDFGSFLASRTIAGAVAGALTRIVIRDSVWTPPIVAVVVTVTSAVLFGVMAPTAWLHHLHHYLWTSGGEIAYNAAIAYPVYFGMRCLGIGFRPEDPYAPSR